MPDRFEENNDLLKVTNDYLSFFTNSSVNEKLREMKWLERAYQKGKMSKELYVREKKRIDEEIANAVFAKEQEMIKKMAGSPNLTLSIKEKHIVIRLKCPCCGTEGENTCGNISFRILGKDREGFMYFECPNCKEHLQYDLMTGRIKIRKGLLGFLFGRFS
jgi:hypothetical protein